VSADERRSQVGLIPRRQYYHGGRDPAKNAFAAAELAGGRRRLQALGNI